MSSLVTIQTLTGTLTAPFDAVQMSETLKLMMDDLDITEENPSTTTIRLTKIDYYVLKKIIEWCTHHKDGNNINLDGPLCPRNVSDEVIEDWVELQKLQEWDKNFFDRISGSLLVQVYEDAHYLGVKGLFELIAFKIANMMVGKSPEQLERQFGLIQDQTVEGRRELDDEIDWLISLENQEENLM